MNVFRFILIALALTALSSHAQVYRWVDKDGKVQYSDKPPPEDAAKSGVKVVDTKPASQPDARPASPNKDNWKEKELDFKERRIAAQQKQAKEEQEAKKAAEERRQRCAFARNSVSTLQERAPLYGRDDKGERVYLQDKDRDSAIVRAKEAVARYCD